MAGVNTFTMLSKSHLQKRKEEGASKASKVRIVLGTSNFVCRYKPIRSFRKFTH